MKTQCCWVALLTVVLVGVKARAADDLEAFQGTWRVVAGESNGQEIPQDQLPANGKVTFEKDHFEITFGDDVAEGTIKVDADRDPKTFDATHESGDHRGDTQYGIYKFEEEKLTVCTAEPGSPESDRPTEFRTRPDGNEVLFVFEREE